MQTQAVSLTSPSFSKFLQPLRTQLLPSGEAENSRKRRRIRVYGYELVNFSQSTYQGSGCKTALNSEHLIHSIVW